MNVLLKTRLSLHAQSPVLTPLYGDMLRTYSERTCSSMSSHYSRHGSDRFTGFNLFEPQMKLR